MDWPPSPWAPANEHVTPLAWPSAAAAPCYGFKGIAFTPSPAAVAATPKGRNVLLVTAVQHFAFFFSFASFVVLMIPISLIYYVGQDAQVRYWITERLSMVLWLIVVFVIAHLIHWYLGRPCRILIVCCTVGSCAFIVILSDIVLIGSYRITNEFRARDCTTFAGKRDVEQEWQAAYSFYANCEFNDFAAPYAYKIEHCKGYQEQLAIHPAWNYLADLEVVQQCGGWCEAGPALWTLLPVRDACTATVAHELTNTVGRNIWKVIIYTIIWLTLSSAALLRMGPLLRKYGVDW